MEMITGERRNGVTEKALACWLASAKATTISPQTVQNDDKGEGTGNKMKILHREA